MLNLILIAFLKLKLGKAFQSILHFFARISAQLREGYEVILRRKKIID